MNYMHEISGHKQSRNVRLLVTKLLFSIIAIQASVTCGTSPQAYVPIVLAMAHEGCANSVPPNNGVSASPAPATPGIVVINEVLSSPQSLWNCAAPKPNNSFNLENAWVEIYNPQNQPLDLYAARASIYDGQNIQGEYRLPFGSIIAAHGFLVVFPFTNPSSGAPIQLSSVHLRIAQIFVDQVSIPPLAADTSYARIPDGSNNWQIMTTPTIASSNIIETVKNGKATRTQNHTTKQKSKNTQRSGTSRGEASAETPATGAQPTWSALHLPSSGLNNAETTKRNSSPPPVSSTTLAAFSASLKPVLFTLLIIVFSFALLWGWRLHRRKKGT
jgi:hypothetical protein